MNPKATTLIEILLYFTIVSIFLFAAFTFSIQILNVNSLSANLYELQSNGHFLVQQIEQAIQAAESVDVTNSLFDDDSGALALTMIDAADSPTLFYFSANNVFMQEGTASPIQLNTDRIKFDFLRFHRVAYPKAPDHIVIDAELSSAVADISNLQNEIPLHLTLSLRNL